MGLTPCNRPLAALSALFVLLALGACRGDNPAPPPAATADASTATPAATPSPTPKPMPTLVAETPSEDPGEFTSVSAGRSHTCGVKTDGQVVCWGDARFGPATPPHGSFVSVSAGLHHTCGVKTDGQVVCWGDDLGGAVALPGGSFVSVSAGWLRTCGVKTDGQVACWGIGVSGENTPPEGSFVSVSAGGEHTCGVRTDGSVTCWGYDEDGQATPPQGEFASVSAGWFHTCGVKTDGPAVCWGDHESGAATPPEGSFVSVSAGAFHTCGVKADGEVVCWGANVDLWGHYAGQSSPPNGPFASVSAGLSHTCGIRTDGSVRCWGSNEQGESMPPGPSWKQVLGDLSTSEQDCIRSKLGQVTLDSMLDQPILAETLNEGGLQQSEALAIGCLASSTIDALVVPHLLRLLAASLPSADGACLRELVADADIVTVFAATLPNASDRAMEVAEQFAHGVETCQPRVSWLWERPIDSTRPVIASPTVGDGIVFAGSYDGRVFALDTATGELLWSYETGGDGNPPPMESGGWLWFESLDLHVFDPYSGELLLKGPYGGFGGPTVSDGAVFWIEPDPFHGFDVHSVALDTGELLWTAELPWRGDVRAVAPVVAGDWVYVLDQSEIYALNGHTGELIWSFDTRSTPSAPSIFQGTVYLTSLDTAYALDGSTGDVLWSLDLIEWAFMEQYPPPSHDLPSVVEGGVWYLPTLDGLYAIVALTGERLWYGEPPEAGSLAVADGMVFGSSLRGSYALDATTGEVVWRRGLRFSWPQVADGVLYGVAVSGDLVAIQASSGELLGRIELGYNHWRRPYALSDGVVYVAYDFGEGDRGIWALTVTALPTRELNCASGASNCPTISKLEAGEALPAPSSVAIGEYIVLNVDVFDVAGDKIDLTSLPDRAVIAWYVMSDANAAARQQEADAAVKAERASPEDSPASPLRSVEGYPTIIGYTAPLAAGGTTVTIRAVVDSESCPGGGSTANAATRWDGPCTAAFSFKVPHTCDTGPAVPNAAANSGLVRDCEGLLALRERLQGDGTVRSEGAVELNWNVELAMTSWTGVTVGGSPARVTKLRLANSGLTGELLGWMGNLTALTELRLNGNRLTGMVPSKLGQLARLTHLYLAGNRLEGCLPSIWEDVVNSDLATLGLEYCDPPILTWGRKPLEGGKTYRFNESYVDSGFILFDVPEGVTIELSVDDVDCLPDMPFECPGAVVRFKDVKTGSELFYDPVRDKELTYPRRYIAPPSGSEQGDASSVDIDKAFDELLASLWFGPDCAGARASDALLRDCEALLALKAMLAGDGTLNWSAALAMTHWEGVTVGGSPERVTKLRLASAGLTGQVSGLMGNLTELTELHLNGNRLTGRLPSKLGQLTNLTRVYLAGNSFTGCVPPLLRTVTNNDIARLALTDCPAPIDISNNAPLLTGGTYKFLWREDGPPFIFDVPAGLTLEVDGYL